MEAFGATFHNQVGLEEINTELCAVVAKTMEPEIVGLWVAERRPGD